MTVSASQIDANRTLASLLAERGTLPVAAALALVRSLTLQVADLHAAGMIHGAIVPATVVLNDHDLPRLETPVFGAMLRLDGDWSGLLPELTRLPLLNLPATIEAAAKLFQKAGISLDPRQIDLCQLGALWCRLLTGESAGAYLRSPRVKGLVPVEVRPLLERILGTSGRERFADVREFAVALQAVAEQFGPPATMSGAEELPGAADPAATAAPARSTGDTAPSFVLSGNQSADTSVAPGLPPAAQGEHSASPTAGELGGDEALPFARLGHYEIVGRIGRGGMGDVYLGYEQALNRRVAIKVLPADLARSDDFVRRFRIEATAVAGLTHPNIVPIHFIGEDHGHHFYVMQFIEGESLAELLGRKGPLPADETLMIAGQVLAGLAAAHQQGLVHRDIKPGNVLLDRSGRRALLADFGLVKSLESSVTGKTATGVVMGTVDYISPEQGRGLAVDARSDLYSMGVLLYRMLSGRLPFTADSPTALIFQHVYESPPALQAAAPDVSAALASVVARLLAKSPADRHQSAEELLADLRALRSGQPLPGNVERAALQTIEPLRSSRRNEIRKTTIIAAPQFDEDPSLPLEMFETRSLGWWEQTCDRALSLFRRHAPELLQQLQNTSQQVDAAIALQSRRKRELEQLIAEAESVLEELNCAAEVQRRASGEARRRAAAPNNAEPTGAAESEELACREAAQMLERQSAEQQEQLELIRLRLAKVTAALQQLQNQRDLFAARLKVAGIGRQRSLSGRRIVSVVAALIVVLIVGRLVWIGMFAVPLGSDLAGHSVAPIETTDADDQPTMPRAAAVTVAEDQVPLSLEAPILTLKGHHRAVQTVAFHPSGKLLASGADDTTAIVWDLGSGRPVHTVRQHVNGVNAVAFSPDGALLASGGGSAGVSEKTLKLWNTFDWSPIIAARGETQLVHRIEFAGSKSLAAMIYSGAGVDLRLLDAVSGDEIETIKVAGIRVTAFAVHPLGFEVLIGGNDGLIRVWDVQRREQSRIFHGRHQGSIGALAYNTSDGKQVISSAIENGELKVWDSATGVLFGETTLPTSSDRIIAFAPDGKRFAVGRQNRLLLGDVPSLKLRKAFPMKSIRCLAFSPDGSKIAAGGAGPQNTPTEAELVVWNARLPPEDQLLALLKRNGGDLSRALAEGMPGARRSGNAPSNVNWSFSGLDQMTQVGFDEKFTVTDDGLRKLAGLTHLEQLSLSKMPVTEAGLKHLAGLKRLRELYLSDTEISDSAGAELSALTGLEVLDLSRTVVSDQTMEQLKTLPFLKQLNLTGTKISDLALDPIAEMTELKKLTLARTKTTAVAVDKLREALPGCEIKW
jgi:serine/threonine protein kinase